MKLALLPAVLLLSACQTIVTTPPADCTGYIPERWRESVAGYPLPAADTLPEWQKFGVGQSGQLTKSNEKFLDAMQIIEECEKRANAARPRKKFLGVF